MEKGLFENRNLDRVSFVKRPKRWEVPFRNRGKGEGFLAKLPSPSSLLHGKQRRRPRGVGGGQSGRSGLRGWPWTGEKGRGGYGGPIPGLTLS